MKNIIWKRKKMIKVLDIKRRNAVNNMVCTIVAMIILGYHFYGNGKKHFLGEGMGVEIFSIIAGFLLFREYDKKGVAELEREQKFAF